MKVFFISLSLLLTTQLSGCFFFYIPGSVIDSVLGQPKPEAEREKK